MSKPTKPKIINLEQLEMLDILSRKRDKILHYLFEEQRTGKKESTPLYLHLMDHYQEALQYIKTPGNPTTLPTKLAKTIEDLEFHAEEIHHDFLSENPLGEKKPSKQNQQDRQAFLIFLEKNKKLPLIDQTKHVWMCIKLIKNLKNLPPAIKEKIVLIDNNIQKAIDTYETNKIDRDQDNYETMKIVNYHDSKYYADAQTIFTALEDAYQILETSFYGWSNNVTLKNKWEEAILPKVIQKPELTVVKQSTTQIFISSPPLQDLPLEALDLKSKLKHFYDKEEDNIREYFLMQELGNLLEKATDETGLRNLKNKLEESYELKKVWLQFFKPNETLNKETIKEIRQKIADKSNHIFRTLFIEGQQDENKKSFCDSKNLTAYAKHRFEWERTEGYKPIPNSVYYAIYIDEANRQKNKAEQSLQTAKRDLTACKALLTSHKEALKEAQTNFGGLKKLVNSIFSNFFIYDKKEFDLCKARVIKTKSEYKIAESNLVSAYDKVKRATEYQTQVQQAVERLSKKEAEQQREAPQATPQKQTVTQTTSSKNFDNSATQITLKGVEQRLVEIEREQLSGRTVNPTKIIERLKLDEELLNNIQQLAKSNNPELAERASSLAERIKIKINILGLIQNRQDEIKRSKGRFFGLFDNKAKSTPAKKTPFENTNNKRSKPR